MEAEVRSKFEEYLEQKERERNELLAEMIESVQILAENARMASEIIRSDIGLMDRLDCQVQTNVEKVARMNLTMKQMLWRGMSMNLRIVLWFFIIFTTWFGVVIWMAGWLFGPPYMLLCAWLILCIFQRQNKRL